MGTYDDILTELDSGTSSSSTSGGTYDDLLAEVDAPTPAPAGSAAQVPPKEDGWGGGLWSDIKHVVSRVPENAAEVGRSLAQLPSGVVNEVNDTLAFLTGGQSDKLLAAAEKLPQPEIPLPGDTTVESRQAAAGPKDLTQVRPSNIAQVPIVRLMPGAFIADKAANDPGAILENPVITALDVLPFVGKTGKLATKGSALAESAAARAESIGKIAKADRITQQGMKLPEIVQEATRQVEERVVRRFPSMTGKTPSGFLERSGLAGERLRASLQQVGVRSRAFTKDVIEEQRAILDGTKEWEKQGVDAPTQSRLLAEAEVADRSWWDARSDADRGFLNWFRAKQDDLYEAIDSSKKFDWDNERYTQAQAPGLYRQVQRLQTLQKWRANLDKRTPKTPESAARLERHKNRYDLAIGERTRLAEQQAVTAYPGKFSKLVNERMRPQIAEAVEASRAAMEAEGVSFPMPDEMVSNLLRSGSYRQLQRAGVISEEALTSAAREAAASWQALRAAGFDPMHVHHVPSMRRRRLASPRFDPIHLLKEPSAIKARTWDMEPWVPEASVSLLDQAVDIVQSRHAATWLGEMQRNGMLKSTQDVTLEVADAVGRMVKGMDPDKAATRAPQLMEQLQQKLYTEFTPGGIFPLTGGKMTGGAQAVYIPKGIAKVIEQMAKPPRLVSSLPERPGITTLPMRAFRVSVLYTQPGYYIGNSIGNALMMTARGNPLDLRYLPRAIKAWKKGELPIEISMGPVLGAADEGFKASLHKMGWQAIDDLDASVWSKAGDRMARAESFLQRFAGALDDMTKATAYFSKFERSARKGASAELSIARAVEHMNKVNMGLDTLLPMERAVMRGVLMPFYSWSKFALGYIMSYPFDHPWRAAFLNNMSRQIREEWDERLPERLMGYWPIGEDANGKTKLYPASGIYPFQSFFSTNDIWTGALRRMSPILQTAQEYSGIDPFTGAPNPYVSWDEELWEPDPVSGQPRYRRPKLSSLVAKNYLPQTELIFDSLSPKEQEYYKKNPGRWVETLLRSFGVPSYITRDMKEEQEKYAKVQARFGP